MLQTIWGWLSYGGHVNRVTGIWERFNCFEMCNKHLTLMCYNIFGNMV